MMYWNPWSMRPPPQPIFPSAAVDCTKWVITNDHIHLVQTVYSWYNVLEQSTRFCSERDTSLPVALKCCPSKEPVVLKAQQEPHTPCGSRINKAFNGKSISFTLYNWQYWGFIVIRQRESLARNECLTIISQIIIAKRSQTKLITNLILANASLIHQ